MAAVSRSRTRRQRVVAFAVNLGHALRHHHDLFAGVRRYVAEHPAWDLVIEPFISHAAGRTARRGRPVDGAIVRATREDAAWAAASGVPIVNTWSASPAAAVPTVLSDYRAAGAAAADYLIRHGYRTLAYQGFRGHRGSRYLWEGFAGVARDRHVSLLRQLISSNNDANTDNWEAFSVRLNGWIDQWPIPIGLLTANDLQARYVINACLHRGLRVPEDVAVIGCGNELILCGTTDPTISSLDLGFERVGYEAARLLERLMDGATPPASPVWVPPQGLVHRRSTSSFAVDDEVVTRALRFMAEHSHEAIGIADVARETSTTPRSLERHFRKAGLRAAEELGRIRLEHAKRMLAETDEPVKSLAMQCGYSGSKYLHQALVRQEGIGPREYRRRYRSRSNVK